MNKWLKILLLTVVVLALILLAIPIVSVSIWKSATLEKSNAAVVAINKSGFSAKDFDAKTDASLTDFDNLIATLKSENSAIETARDQAKTVGGLKALDLSSNYKSASETSGELVAIYDEFLKFNTSEIASLEAEKLIVAALSASGNASDAKGIAAQAQSLRAANTAYQKFLDSGLGSEYETRFSAISVKLADALERSAQAIASGNLAQLNNSDGELQEVIKELDALEPLRSAQSAIKQNKIQASIDKLNKTIKELE